MSVPSNRSASKANAAARRSGKGASRPPNRAQLRAMEARAQGARASSAAPVVETTVEPSSPAREAVAVGPRTRTARARASQAGRGRARHVVSQPAALSREEEYRFIRDDVNRLLITAGSLLLVMIVLLLVL